MFALPAPLFRRGRRGQRAGLKLAQTAQTLLVRRPQKIQLMLGGVLEQLQDPELLTVRDSKGVATAQHLNHPLILPYY